MRRSQAGSQIPGALYPSSRYLESADPVLGGGKGHFSLEGLRTGKHRANHESQSRGVLPPIPSPRPSNGIRAYPLLWFSVEWTTAEKAPTSGIFLVILSAHDWQTAMEHRHFRRLHLMKTKTLRFVPGAKKGHMVRVERIEPVFRSRSPPSRQRPPIPCTIPIAPSSSRFSSTDCIHSARVRSPCCSCTSCPERSGYNPLRF